MQCGLDVCTCQAPEGDDFCGPTCRMGIVDSNADPCKCGHADCRATVGGASAPS